MTFYTEISGMTYFKSVVPKLSEYQNHLEGLLQYRTLGPIPSIPDSAGLQRGPRICIPNKFPGEGVAAGPLRTLGALLFSSSKSSYPWEVGVKCFVFFTLFTSVRSKNFFDI